MFADSDATTVLSVEDDGRGFDPAEILLNSLHGHFGLHLMADAAARCGARLAVSSSPGRGTSLRMTMEHS
jgi:nitrate/nitrite-specific signal transduction histidine kinase